MIFKELFLGSYEGGVMRGSYSWGVIRRSYDKPLPLLPMDILLGEVMKGSYEEELL